MPLNKQQLGEINQQLKNKALDLPDFRRTISDSGQNAQWIKTKITARNKNLPKRLLELIDLI